MHLFGKHRQLDRELDDEIQAHLALAAEDRVDRGESPDEARYAARRELGNATQIKETTREVWIRTWAEQLGQDLRFALRWYRKNPGFALTAVAVMALGIGANTAIFSIINGVLLKPLPYSDPDRLMFIREAMTGISTAAVSYPNFLDWRAQNKSFTDLAALRNSNFNLTGSGDSERLRGRMVSASFFSILNVKTILGRTFNEGEDRAGGRRVALISEILWKRRFSGNPGLLGRTLTLNGIAYTVIGILPSNFQFELTPFVGGGWRDEVFVPIGQWDSPVFRDRYYHPGILAIGRLRPDAALERARADLGRIAANLAQEYPKTNDKHGVFVTPLKDMIVGDVRPILYVLIGAVGFVLLICCANIASLFLSRAAAREAEIAMRSALGASRFRIVRQLLTESVLLSLFGGAAGLAVAFIAVPFLLKAAPQGLPRLDQICMDARVLGFTVLISVLSGVLFGLAPALRSSNTLPASGWRESGQRVVRGHHWVRDLLVAGEVAFALVLVTGSVLMIRTIAKLSGVDPGFDPRNVLVFGVTMAPGQERTAESVRRAYTTILDRIRLIPGIETVSSADDLPLSGDEDEMPVWVEGTPRPKSTNDAPWILLYRTMPDYLRVMKIPLIRGRFFNEHDDENSPRVAVIDEALSRRLFAGQDPIGKRLAVVGPGYDFPLRIVGIVGSVKHLGLDGRTNGPAHDGLYIPVIQDPFVALSAGGIEVVLRTRSNPLRLMEAIRKQITEQNPDQIVSGFRTMDEMIAGTLSQRRFVALLLGIFAGVALLLASVGIFGVVAYSVVQRTQEIGIRMALGSDQRDALRLIVGHGALVTGAGVAAGIALALFATRSLASLLYGVSATDPVIFAVVSGTLTAVALLASYLPARRAARIDPVLALRYE